MFHNYKIMTARWPWPWLALWHEETANNNMEAGAATGCGLVSLAAGDFPVNTSETGIILLALQACRLAYRRQLDLGAGIEADLWRAHRRGPLAANRNSIVLVCLMSGQSERSSFVLGAVHLVRLVRVFLPTSHWI